jgi:hypothetical protein
MADALGIGSALDPNQGAEIEGVEPDTSVTTENTSNPQELGSDSANRPNETLKYISFPSAIESLDIPYTLIKIFEIRRIEGDSSRVDETSTDPNSPDIVQSGVSAAEEFGNVTPFLSPEAAAGAAAGYAAGGAGGAVVGAAVGSTAASKIEQVAGLEQGDLVRQPLKRLKNFSLKRNMQQVEFALALPMPENLASQYTQNYEELSLTQAFGVIGGLSQAIAAKRNNLMSGGGLDPYIMEAAAGILGNLPGISNASKGIFFGTTGLAVNPQLEMIYSNPQLRQFQFDFILTAKNSIDSKAISNIIKQLKIYSHPEIPKGTVGRYYIPPAQFEIEFHNPGSVIARNQNTFLFKTKKSVLRDITVDYTSAGTFATFADGAPVQVRLSLTFQEASILTRQDFVQEDGLY